MSGNNDYTTENILDYSCHQNYYKLIGIDLSRQINMTISQQTNFIEKIEKNNGATMLFIVEMLQKKLF